jgi:betaine lipid synthase
LTTHTNCGYRCHPTYLSPQAHVRLSTPGAFDGLRIHTDEINEVINRITPGTLTIAVVSITIPFQQYFHANANQVMDSMDWFDPAEDSAPAQARTFNKALKKGGRILLRSASINPWYIKHFEENGFTARRVGARFPGTCIDR